MPIGFQFEGEDSKLRVLVCGDRFWEDKDMILNALSRLGPSNIEVVIEGECRGADLMGKESAEELGIPVLKFPAKWDRYKKAAGPIRNQQMLDEGNPNLVLAFHDNIHSSSGTSDMMKRARRSGIEVRLLCHTKSF